jgi:hypothetical protein
MRQAANHLDAAGIVGLAKVIRVHVAAMEKGSANPHRSMNSPMGKPMPMGKPGPGRARHDGRGRDFPSVGRPFTPPQRLGMQAPAPKAKPKAPASNVPSAKDPMNPNAALIGEIRKLRQEMGDLRKQVNRIQGDTKRKAARDKAAPAPATR